MTPNGRPSCSPAVREALGWVPAADAARALKGFRHFRFGNTSRSRYLPAPDGTPLGSDALFSQYPQGGRFASTLGLHDGGPLGHGDSRETWGWLEPQRPLDTRRLLVDGFLFGGRDHVRPFATESVTGRFES